MHRYLRWSLMLLVLAMSLSSRAAIWIRDFQGAPKDYRLERNGQPLPVQYYQTLQTGDRLWVEPDHELRLERDDGTVIAVKPTDSPYTVPDSGTAPGVLANLAAWAGGWLHEDHNAEPRSAWSRAATAKRLRCLSFRLRRLGSWQGRGRYPWPGPAANRRLA